MDDDFGTPEAFSVLFDLAKEINKIKSSDLAYASQLGGLLVRLGDNLGILQAAPETFLRSSVSTQVDPQEIDALIAQRVQARADKDWALADEIREKLTQLKVVVEDSAEGSTWRIER